MRRYAREAVVLDVVRERPGLLDGDAIPERGRDRDVVARARGEIEAEAICADLDLRPWHDSHARHPMREFVGDCERELVVGPREADEARRHVEVVAARAVGEHEVADLEKRL